MKPVEIDAKHKVCKHCQKIKYIKSRGLCDGCYHSPEIRYQYEVYADYDLRNPRGLAGENPCLHCTIRRAVRPRGLCQKCYQNLEVRDCYPPATHKNFKEGNGIGNINAILPNERTNAKPGTLEKLFVFEKRAEAKVCLFHPEDAKADEEDMVGMVRLFRTITQEEGKEEEPTIFDED